MTNPSRPTVNAHVISDLLPILAVAIVAVFLVNWHQLADPFVRHDDYPALLGLPDEYYRKTLEEGRWLNYWWIARPWIWSPQMNFYIYLVGWATFAAAFAANALGSDTKLIWRGTLAVLIVLTPQAFHLVQWFNTLVPGVWVLAIYSVLCLCLNWRWSAGLLLIFSPLSFSAYSTFPFLLLVVLMTRHDLERNWRNLVVIFVVFAASFALAMGAAYGLNWIFHGVFGIEVGEWRKLHQASNLQDLIGNLAVLKKFLAGLVGNYGLGIPLVGFIIFMLSAFAFVVVFFHDKWMALFSVTPAVLGLGLLSAYTLQSGVFFPPRASVFLWMSACHLWLHACFFLRQAPKAHITASALIGLIVLYLGAQMFQKYSFWFGGWQASTRAIAEQIPSGVDKIVVYGDRFGIEGAVLAVIQSDNGLRLRMQWLTGLGTIVCNESSEECDVLEPPFDVGADFGEIQIEKKGKIAFVLVPPRQLKMP